MEIGQKIIPITSKILHIWKQLGEFKGGRIEKKISRGLLCGGGIWYNFDR